MCIYCPFSYWNVSYATARIFIYFAAQLHGLLWPLRWLKPQSVPVHRTLSGGRCTWLRSPKWLWWFVPAPRAHARERSSYGGPTLHPLTLPNNGINPYKLCIAYRMVYKMNDWCTPHYLLLTPFQNLTATLTCSHTNESAFLDRAS